jgi:hypothetical protein
MEDSRVSSTITKTNCVQVRMTVICLGTNMKDYATGEHCMDHSHHPRLREYLFEVANELLTVPRAVCNLGRW